MRKYKIRTKENGFTLIEVLVSIALFTVVLTISMGTILVISDSNKKARSLMTVMTNLNFAVDSMTRSFKVGENPSLFDDGDCLNGFKTTEYDYAGAEGSKRDVTYCFAESGSEPNVRGRITKRVVSSSADETVDFTPPDVDIDHLSFYISGTTPLNQPILYINMEGTVKINEKISSNFSIQTSVSQRKLNI